MDLASLMKNPKFRIVPIPTEVADTARRNAANGLPDHEVVTAADSHSYPCRHCLQWAEPGEQVILFPYAAIPAGRPYSESGPIFVHAESCRQYAASDEYPSQFREGRAFRAYNSDSYMIDAQLPNGGDMPEVVIERLFANPDTSFVHARSASRGCYTFRIQRI